MLSARVVLIVLFKCALLDVWGSKHVEVRCIKKKSVLFKRWYIAHYCEVCLFWQSVCVHGLSGLYVCVCMLC